MNSSTKITHRHMANPVRCLNSVDLAGASFFAHRRVGDEQSPERFRIVNSLPTLSYGKDGVPAHRRVRKRTVALWGPRAC